MIIFNAGKNAAKTLAAFSQAVQLDARLKPFIGLEIRQAGQRPVDTGRRHFQRELAGDRINLINIGRDGARQAGALGHIDLAVRLALGHDLQKARTAGLTRSLQAHAHDIERQFFGDRIENFEQLAFFSGLGAQSGVS